MSVSVVRPFLKTRLNALGYKEWNDAFNSQNIPSTVMDKSYFVSVNEARGVGLNHHDQEIVLTSEISLFFKGHRKPSELFDDINDRIEALIFDVLKPQNRVGQHNGGIKNIIFTSFRIDPLDGSNDNSVRVVVFFDFLVSIKP